MSCSPFEFLIFHFKLFCFSPFFVESWNTSRLRAYLFLYYIRKDWVSKRMLLYQYRYRVYKNNHFILSWTIRQHVKIVNKVQNTFIFSCFISIGSYCMGEVCRLQGVRDVQWEHSSFVTQELKAASSEVCSILTADTDGVIFTFRKLHF
jgi:hypothetical protein